MSTLHVSYFSLLCRMFCNCGFVLTKCVNVITTINSGTQSTNHCWTKSSSYAHQQEDEEGGFFAKRFGIVKQKEHNTAGRRLDGFLGNGPFSNEHPNGDYLYIVY